MKPISLYKQVKAKHLDRESGKFVKTYWNEDECAYVLRLDENKRRFVWYCADYGVRSWIVQIMDNEGNQIGDAEYYANRHCLPRNC